MRNKRKWMAGLIGLLTASACVLSGCSSAESAAKAAVAPVEAASGDASDNVFVGWCTDSNGNGTWYKPNQNAGKLTTNLDLYAQWAKKTTNFSYTGSVQTFTAKADGTYQIEVWGAEGGGDSIYKGGKGGYSRGEVKLQHGQTIYVSVGQAGSYVKGANNTTPATFNGGGRGQVLDRNASGDANGAAGSGGGASSVQLSKQGDGQLVNYKSVADTDVLIVAGGGGGANYCNGSNYASGGYGGGTAGGDSVTMGARDWSRNGGSAASGGNQTGTGCGPFGAAAVKNGSAVGGGGGWYSGNNSGINGAGGGSGHIGTPMLSGTTTAGNKSFTSPSGASETGHSGNGYARITLEKADYAG